MTEATEVQSATATKIRPNIANMVKTKSGSYHKADFVGETLNGLTVDQVKEIGTELGLDVAKYSHLNPGQIRMTIGNKLRAMTKEVPETNEDGTALEAKALDKAVAANKAAEEVRDNISVMADKFKETNAEIEAARIAAKAKTAPKVADGENEGSVE